MNRTKAKCSVIPAAPPASGARLLRIEEVCLQLSLGVITIRRAVKAGLLRSVRLSPCTTRFEQSAVDEFVASRVKAMAA